MIAAPPTVGIVSTTKNAHHLHDWIAYHKKMGVDYIALYFDDAEPDQQNIKIANRYDGVTSIIGYRAGDAPTLTTKQLSNVLDGLNYLKGKGCDWVFHIDDDELIYVKPDATIGEAIARLKGINDCHGLICRNYESLRTLPGVEDYNYFRAEKWFVTQAMLAYPNGKSAANIRFEGQLSARGVHRFRFDNGPTKQCQQNDIVILHYPFHIFSRFYEKCKDGGVAHNSPFALYKLIGAAIGDSVNEHLPARLYQTTVVSSENRIENLRRRGKVVELDVMGKAEATSRRLPGAGTRVEASQHDGNDYHAHIETRNIALVQHDPQPG